MVSLPSASDSPAPDACSDTILTALIAHPSQPPSSINSSEHVSATDLAFSGRTTASPTYSSPLSQHSIVPHTVIESPANSSGPNYNSHTISTPLSITSDSATTLETSIVYKATSSQQERYCIPGVRILSTDNPTAFLDRSSTFAYTPKKAFRYLDDPQFVEHFTTHLCDPIDKLLLPLKPCVLHPIRLGFPSSPDFPKVLLVILLGDFPDKGTGELLISMRKVLSNSPHSVNTYIDICKWEPRSSGVPGTDDTNITEICESSYRTLFPPPGSSVGNGSDIGTLTAYVKFALKNEGDVKYLALCSRHTFTDSKKGQDVFSPSETDHQKTKEALQLKIKLLKLNDDDDWKHYEKIKSEADTYNNVLGTVWATSESSRAQGIPSAKHVRQSRFDKSGFDCQPYRNGHLSFTEDDVVKAAEHFRHGPNFLGIRTLLDKELALKPASRSTREWTIGRVNEVPSTFFPAVVIPANYDVL
ncbi:hypothetical protein DL98DRAFT_593628 [Cadophora sp. DSE1049]|nr:hypothetical protein DL98DRAFT_593628 [Cadophora sp. DSE1049]